MDETPTPERILVVFAHPDDADFGCGASVARWIAEGAQVTYCALTDGGAGGSDLEVDRGEVPGIRRAEQRAAAEVLGVKDVVFLGYADGALEVTLDLRRDVSRVIRQVRPQRVVCQSPEWNWDAIYSSHPDHRAAGAVALAAVYPDSRNPFAHPELRNDEGLEPHTVDEVWLMNGQPPNTYVDVTDHFAAKVAALRCHASQLDPEWDLEEFLGERLRGHAERAGLEEGRMAEPFQVVWGP